MIPLTEPDVSTPRDITTGPDGNLWFTVAVLPGIARMNSTTRAVDVFTDPNIDRPAGIASGPDGRLWFISFNSDRIGAITPAGEIQTFADPGIDGPEDITTGPTAPCGSRARTTTA